jgi:hypothetical protein
MTIRKDRARHVVFDRLRQDLIGPHSAEEILTDSPSEVYMSGILYAQKSTHSGDEPVDSPQSGDDDDEAAPLSPQNGFRPSSMGLSFAIKPVDGDAALLRATVDLAQYDVETAHPGEGRPKCQWRRRPAAKTWDIELPGGPISSIEPVPGVDGLGFWLRWRRYGDLLLVTIMLVNQNKRLEAPGPGMRDLGNFHQVYLTIEAYPGFGTVVPKPSIGADNPDRERQSAELLYSDAAEFAVGHTSSATWATDAEGNVILRTDWLPSVEVPSASPNGDEAFFAKVVKPGADFVLGAEWLSIASDTDVLTGLGELCSCYSSWIEAREAEIAELPDKHREAAMAHMLTCRTAAMRMREGTDFLGADPQALLAFRLANRALWLQNEWKRKHDPEIGTLIWRPFQLAFGLLCLQSSTDPENPARKVMDLLWFPTGGGKTEAYLLLTAFSIFLRRLRAKGAPDAGGVTVFMRYTLRLLTAQQFQRAAAMILACDMIRRGDHVCPGAGVPSHFSKEAAISIGLWVGQDTTPNRIKDVGVKSSPAQVAVCPDCGGELDWNLDDQGQKVLARCLTPGCIVNGAAGHLPFWTVDEDVYRELPSLLIGTADKFVQIVSKKETGRLFGLGYADRQPPDLIIQDELHLISGPLGSMAGLFETAIDELCSRGGRRPKIIGSTATIRRAHEQINALFDRDAFQFPPPGLNHGNSGFSVEEIGKPGRLYVGVTSVGRTASYIYQAIASSLLQSASDRSLAPDEQDHYWTMVGYFNALRELGSASIIMQDDVTHTMGLISAWRGETARHLQPPLELTSRVPSDQIRDRLRELERPRSSGAAADVVLASNMISVGMDIPRLGLMLVSGQPKTIAEYIQATSRVGRGRTPGLVVTLYNANKMRDRSRYESFSTWHRALYRDVEATGVTPFAPRARDKALHAPFVAMVRHLVPGMADTPAAAARHEAEIRNIISIIHSRISRVDADEADTARQELTEFFEKWLRRGALNRYWDNWSDEALLISAETAAESRASGFSAGLARATPNTLRAVEPSTKFVITEKELGETVE